MSDKTELLPCPFCGGTAKIFSAGEHAATAVNCQSCDAYGSSVIGKAAAIAAWNRRATIQPTAAFAHFRQDSEYGPWIECHAMDDGSRAAFAAPAAPADAVRDARNEQDAADLFYLQDSRSYVGNDVLWWGIKGNGYVTDLSKAQAYTKAEAISQHESRLTDIPWPKAYIDGKTRPAVDMQYIKRAEALAGTGIVLREPPKPKPDTSNCHGCGRFMNAVQRYSGDCQNCGADNRP